jgi:hypothetical protein
VQNPNWRSVAALAKVRKALFGTPVTHSQKLNLSNGQNLVFFDRSSRTEIIAGVLT